MKKLKSSVIFLFNVLVKKYASHSSYKVFLREDFHQRCAYCNLKDDQITTYFEVDHFIPSEICKEYNRLDLLTDYSNLIYSCKKCNVAKSNKYYGPKNTNNLENKLFYDPVVIPYENIFFRNELGGIDSYDVKGRQMIVDLKLYRLSHNLVWLSEEMERICCLLNKKIVNESDERKCMLLYKAYALMLNESQKIKSFMIANYNSL